MSIKLTHIEKNFGPIKVLNDINIEIEEGDFLVLLGCSGCGKSTLLNCIAGLEQVTNGKVEIMGRDVTQLDPGKRNLAMVFQSYALYPTMTVARNISFALECQGVKKAEREKTVKQVAELLQITQLLDRKPSQLSGGQRQRVAIGRALVRDPDVYLLDEPMSNLDAKLRSQMRFELKELHRKLGRTFVLVTHDQIEAMSMATKVAVLDQGKVQQFGTPHQVYYEPQNKFVAEFVGLNKMNFLEGRFNGKDGEAQLSIGDYQASLANYQFANGQPSEGQSIIMGVRPESIYRSKTQLEGHQHLEVELPVTRSEMTGSDVQVWFELAGQIICARFRATKCPDIGAMTRLYIDLHMVSLFHSTSEVRL